MTTETSTPTTTGTIERRLAALERSARRWRAAAVVGLLLAFGMGAAGGEEKVHDVITAKSFRVVDGAGNAMAMLGFNNRDDRGNCGMLILGSAKTNDAGEQKLLTFLEAGLDPLTKVRTE